MTPSTLASREAAPANTSGEARFALWVAVGAVLLTAPRLLFHELFRDEAWLWLVATESHSLRDLFGGLSRSGQGFLFPILCWFAARVSTAPQAMQAVNLAVVAAGAYVIARWAPLRATERVLLVLGYYFFYEYAVISRHYAAGVMLTGLACFAARKSSLVLLGVALALLCQTTVYGYFIAMAIASGFLLDRWWRRHELSPVPRRAAFTGVTLALVGAIVGLIQLVPESGTSFAPGWRFGWNTTQALATLQMPWHGFFPLPRPQLEFWNSDLLAHWPIWQALAGAASLALAVIILWPRKIALAVFGIGGLALLCFGYTKYIGTHRHHGHWWLLFIAALWLAGGLKRKQGRRTYRELLLLVLLVLQCGAMLFASWMDLRHPFSNGANTAELIRHEGLDRYPLLGYREPPAASVALALGRPLYAPSRHVFATHTDWGPLQRDISLPELRCSARQLARQEARDIVLVMNSELPAWREITAAGSRVGAILGTENYFLYHLNYSALAGTATEAACVGELQGSPAPVIK
jgi:hypothetical protein